MGEGIATADFRKLRLFWTIHAFHFSGLCYKTWPRLGWTVSYYYSDYFYQSEPQVGDFVYKNAGWSNPGWSVKSILLVVKCAILF